MEIVAKDRIIASSKLIGHSFGLDINCILSIRLIHVSSAKS